MKLTVFQSSKGDCLLLESADGRRVLIDGGMAASYRGHAAATLGALREAGERLDLIYVSHIDEDHISGVLELMDAELDWRVHDFQLDSGNAGHRPPKRPRPPEIGELWHNAFSDLVPANSGAITDLLAMTAAVLDFGSEAEDPERAERHRELATSVSQGIRLSRRVGSEQLKVPLNRAFGGKLALVRDGQAPIALGSLELTVIGPFADDLDVLRDEWNDWLRKNRAKVEKARARMRVDVERLGVSEIELLQAALESRAAELGDRRKVTAPNLASLMLLVDEGDSTVLLTGDGHATDILKGLEHAGRLDAEGAIHVDVLKVQHHGAEFNITPEFCRRVTADHYVFCGNGAHHNPDLRALEAVLDSRLGSAPARSSNAQAGDPFKLWFNSSPHCAGSDSNRRHMIQVQKLVARYAKKHRGALIFEFLDDHFFELAL